MTTTIAAHSFTLLILVTAVFQLALAAGAPWGAATMGGRFPGRLPLAMRGVAIVSAAILVGFAAVVEVRAGIIVPNWQPFTRTAIWFVVGYCALGTLANAITPSRWERIIWLPVVGLALISSLAVALS